MFYACVRIFYITCTAVEKIPFPSICLRPADGRPPPLPFRMPARHRRSCSADARAIAPIELKS